MNDLELDDVYTSLCRHLSAAGQAGALALLARFALLTSLEIDDPARVEALLVRAAEGLAVQPTDQPP